jgi:superfamily II DNA or RNA helicase
MPLVFLPDVESPFIWGDVDAIARELPELVGAGRQHRAVLVTPDGKREVEGLLLPVLDATAALAVVSTTSLEALPASVAIWALASKLSLELVAQERVVPTIARRAGRVEARWAAALSSSDDAAKVAALSRSMPPAGHAVPITAPDVLLASPKAKKGAASHDNATIGVVESDEVWAPEALVRAYLDAVVDALVRASRGGPELPRAGKRSRNGGRLESALQGPVAWDQRFRAALEGPERGLPAEGFAERAAAEAITRWSEPALGAADRLRACFRLELPVGDRDPFLLRFMLQSPEDPSLLVPAAEVWNAAEKSLGRLGRAFRDPEESLLEALGRASRLFAPIERTLASAKPESMELDPATAFAFLGDGAAALADAGFGVIVPGELTRSGQRRLRLRMRVGGKSRVAGAVSGNAGLALDELIAVDWQAVIGDDALTPRELAVLAKQKAPLVRFRGAWVAIDPRELGEIQKHLERGPRRIPLRDAVAAALAGESHEGDLPVSVAATGALAALLERLETSRTADATAPATLRATLRPYQERGLNWLASMASLGLGACLADDMGLGKTMQLLAFLLRRVEDSPRDDRPALLVAPMSVVGNWEREIRQFSPTLSLVPHYGPERARAVADFPKQVGALVVTTYGLLRRDRELLTGVDWSVVALDEAQNIKNAASATAVAARSLGASHRFALTGTPVENRLAELWSILEFANPGLLGPLERFRREFAVPIERYGNEDAAGRLRRIASPFILRRVKTDPSVIRDLPAKNEMSVVCTLTREQATLYKAVVDEEMRRIEQAEGMERRGRVLALLTHTKQICNHPAQYLSEKGPLAGRSGKLGRVTEMLEEALAAGDKALVFTQFREMGDRLVAHFEATLGCEVAFLHGGTPKSTRDALVERFQREPRGPRVFVLSVKAGGTGLNLTAANHVFHYDRWWNPAVEDQATDRAYRIGQTRAVQVHKLVCAGTVEEKIARMLEQKRDLASKVVGAGEQWITELDSAELRDLFSLSKDAVVASDDGDTEPAPRKKNRETRSEARS